MSCPHGNPVRGCDICDEIDVAWAAGFKAGTAEAVRDGRDWLHLCDMVIVGANPEIANGRYVRIGPLPSDGGVYPDKGQIE